MFCKPFCLYYISVGVPENMIEFIATEKLIKDMNVEKIVRDMIRFVCFTKYKPSLGNIPEYPIRLGYRFRFQALIQAVFSTF